MAGFRGENFYFAGEDGRPGDGHAYDEWMGVEGNGSPGEANSDGKGDLEWREEVQPNGSCQSLAIVKDRICFHNMEASARRVGNDHA